MTKIVPHYNCLQGEHVFIPNQTFTNTRSTFIESFVCTHCLVVVDKRQWESHQQELKRIAEAMKEPEVPFPAYDEKISGTAMIQEVKPYMPVDYKEPMKPAVKKPAPKPVPKKV